MPTIGRHHFGSTRNAYPALCDVCGVPWPRHRLRRDAAGKLVCPDEGDGLDQVTLDRGNAAGARHRPRAAPADAPLYRVRSPDPSSILGDDLHTWLRAEFPQDFELTGQMKVASWHNLNLLGDPVRSADNQRPRWLPQGAISASVGACVAGDGTQTLACAITALASSSRPYFWTVGQALATSAPKWLFSAASTSSTGVLTTAGTNFNCNLRCSDGIDAIVGPAIDQLAHLFEFGALATTAGRFVVDGVAYAGAKTGGLEAALTTLTIFGPLSGPQTMKGRMFEMVISTVPPSAAQASAMRDYFEARPFGLTIA